MARQRSVPRGRRRFSPPARRRGVPWQWLVAVAVAALVGVGGLIYLGSRNSPAVTKTPVELAQGASLGSPEARVTLEVFSDFL